VGYASKVRQICLITLVIALAGCSHALRWTPEYHEVKTGDTVYSIAWRYGLDQRELVKWNNLDRNGLIYPGQKLRLSPTAGRSASTAGGAASPPVKSGSNTGRNTPSAPAQKVSSWQWPTAGKVTSGFGASTKTQSGIQIAGRERQPVVAAAGGEVVYSGSGLPGYGQLLIIKHNSDYLSAYGHNDSLLVGEGDQVKSGQRIARMGTDPGKRYVLHFEIRRHGEPVNPLNYLPRR
jgi:lipoprotein NlpD